MKKSLLKKLTRMARDGDPEAIEALAEAVEQIIENPPDDSDTAAVIIAAEPDGTEAPAVSPDAGEGENANPGITDDSDVLAAILERLDRLVALLTPAAGDDIEELAEAAEKAAEAAEAEIAEAAAEEIAAIVGEAVGEAAGDEPDPIVSTVLEPEDEEAGGDCTLPRETGDALRAAIQAIRPALKRMPRRERVRVCADIAARLKHTVGDSRAYAALASGGARRAPAQSADLGRQIMARRNPNYKN